MSLPATCLECDCHIKTADQVLTAIENHCVAKRKYDDMCSAISTVLVGGRLVVSYALSLDTVLSTLKEASNNLKEEIIVLTKRYVEMCK